MSKAEDKRIAELAGSLARGLQALDRPGLYLVHAFLHYRDRGATVPESVLSKIEAAFRRVVAGESADVVLGTKRRRRGKPADPDIVVRNLMFAWRLQELRKSGLTVDAAVERLSRASGVGEETLRAIAKHYRVRITASGIEITN